MASSRRVGSRSSTNVDIKARAKARFRLVRIGCVAGFSGRSDAKDITATSNSCVCVEVQRILWPCKARRAKDEAYQEMLSHHFHPTLHGLHEFWESFDVARWRASYVSWK